MAHVPPPSDEMLNLVAELRADGKTWEAIAKQVNRAPRTIRRWRLKYLERWQPIQVRAERHTASEAECESVLVLRMLLRSKDEKVRWHAAKSLLSLRIDLGKLDIQRPPPSASSSLPPELVFLTQIQGRTDAELDAILHTLEPLPDAEAGANPADAAGGPA